jgi:dipeptidase D
MLTGRLLVNLDSEDWGVIYIGCAGAGDTNITLKVARDAAAAPAGARPYKVGAGDCCSCLPL